MKHTDVDTISEKTLVIMDGKGNRADFRAHVLPLTPKTLAEVEGLLNRYPSARYLFPSKFDQQKHVTSFTISKNLANIFDDLKEKKLIGHRLRYADLRRTIESRMADLDIRQDVRAQIQSHQTGGVQLKHYNESELVAVKRAALLQWEAYLGECMKEAAAR